MKEQAESITGSIQDAIDRLKHGLTSLDEVEKIWLRDSLFQPGILLSLKSSTESNKSEDMRSANLGCGVAVRYRRLQDKSDLSLDGAFIWRRLLERGTRV